MPFYLFECHHGDDNDNAITDEIYDAPSLEVAIDAIDSKAKSLFDSHGAMYDGDDTTHTCLFNPPDYCSGETEDGDPCGESCDKDHRMMHWDHHLKSEHATEEEARKACATFHSFGGVFHINDRGDECLIGKGNEIEGESVGLDDCVNYATNTEGDCAGPHMFRLFSTLQIYCEACYRRARGTT